MCEILRQHAGKGWDSKFDKVKTNCDRVPPNGLPFSCRKRAAETCQNANDLVRAAVGCNGGLGRASALISTLFYIDRNPSSIPSKRKNDNSEIGLPSRLAASIL